LSWGRARRWFLVEAAGRRYLVATGASVTQLPLEAGR
jgi:hypothetical protein